MLLLAAIAALQVTMSVRNELNISYNAVIKELYVVIMNTDDLLVVVVTYDIPLLL